MLVGARYATLIFVILPPDPITGDDGSIAISGLTLNADGSVNMQGTYFYDGSFDIEYQPEE